MTPNRAEPPSRNPLTGWIILALFVPIGVWLLWQIHRTDGLTSPKLWELLRDEPTFGFAMLDFFATAGFAALVLVERYDLKRPRTWIFLVIFCVVPTLGIVLFLVAGRPKVDAPSTDE